MILNLWRYIIETITGPHFIVTEMPDGRWRSHIWSRRGYSTATSPTEAEAYSWCRAERSQV